jgi:hypothetical protein
VITSHTIAFQLFHIFNGLIKVMRRITTLERVIHKSRRAEKAANLISVLLGLPGFAGGMETRKH